MDQLAGKVALVTGASRGIGRAIAEDLGSHGAAVVINYNENATAAQEVAQTIEKSGGRALCVQANVGKPEDAQRLAEEAANFGGQIDILVNNAGMNRDRTLRRMSMDDWSQVIDTNLNSVFYVTKAVLDGMVDRKYGRIVNISSLISQMGNLGQANYAAAKGGVNALTRVVALELARYNITINAVCPGFVDTDMLGGVSEEIRGTILQRIPLGRFGAGTDVASLVRFLVTEGDWITGQEINVNGGMYM